MFIFIKNAEASLWAYKLENEAMWSKASLAVQLRLGEETSRESMQANRKVLAEFDEKVKQLQRSFAGKSEKKIEHLVRAGVREIHDWVMLQGTADAGLPSGASKAPLTFFKKNKKIVLTSSRRQGSFSVAGGRSWLPRRSRLPRRTPTTRTPTRTPAMRAARLS